MHRPGVQPAWHGFCPVDVGAAHNGKLVPPAVRRRLAQCTGTPCAAHQNGPSK